MVWKRSRTSSSAARRKQRERDDALSVRQLPQRIGARLRRLQLQGKVERRETDGVNRWLPTAQHRKNRATAH